MLERLHEAVAAACPIDGVSGEQGAVTVQYRPAATAPQRAAAQAAVAAFDWSPAAHAAWLAAKNPDKRDLAADAAAAVQANADFLALASPTNAQVLAQVRALTRQNQRIIRRLIQLD